MLNRSEQGYRMFEWENTCSRATAAQGEKEEKKKRPITLFLSLSIPRYVPWQ